MAAAWVFAGIGGEAGAQEKPESKPAPPITYQFNDPNPRVKSSAYAVYQAEGVTMMVRHPRRQKPNFDNPTWYASQATGGRIVRVLQAHRPVLVKPGSGDYKPGTPERRRRHDGVAFISYDKLSTKLVRGKDDRTVAGQKTRHYILKVSFEGTHLDNEGEKVAQRTHHYEHHLWIAEHLPYSPAFALPYRIIGRLFVDDDGTRLGEYILDELRPKLRQKGLVLRMEFRQKGAKKPQYVLQADELNTAKKRSVKLPSYPIISQETFAEIAPVSIVSRMLTPSDEEAAKASRFKATLSGDAKGEVEGHAVWGTNEHGDFALLLSLPVKFGDGEDAPDKKVFLLLMRPMHGKPDKGSYEVTDVADDIESLSTEELQELSKMFTVMGVVHQKKKGAKHPDVYALVEAKAGKVTVADDAEALTGELELELRGVKLSDKASDADVTFKASFSAKNALENVGSSTITQVLTR